MMIDGLIQSELLSRIDDQDKKSDEQNSLQVIIDKQEKNNMMYKPNIAIIDFNNVCYQNNKSDTI